MGYGLREFGLVEKFRGRRGLWKDSVGCLYGFEMKLMDLL